MRKAGAADLVVCRGLAVFEEYGGDVGMPLEDVDEFGATVAAMSDDADRGGHDCLFSGMNNYTTRS